MDKRFSQRRTQFEEAQAALLSRPNPPTEDSRLLQRYAYPVLTAAHVPLSWRFDFNPATNPYFLERLGVNAVFNAGAIFHDGKYKMIVRMEGSDRKSFFATAESEHPTEGFHFPGEPIVMPETDDPDTNVYDMRITEHTDGWIYGVFCAERKDPEAPPGDTSQAVAQAGIARTKDLVTWERLPDLRTPSSQQRNAVLHPELVEGKYGFYTRPMGGFLSEGDSPGIGWGFCDGMEPAVIEHESIIDSPAYHTVKELKNGMGPTPLKTEAGWLHVLHGVRYCAAGFRYVLYAYLCDLEKPWVVTHQPGGYLLAPEGEERVGDVSNVLFANGMILGPDQVLYLYYASSDTRMHVASLPLDAMLDHLQNAPVEAYRSAASVAQRRDLIARNRVHL